MAKNLMIANTGQFMNLPSIVVPSLTGVSEELNPDETLQIFPSQASWLCECFDSNSNQFNAMTIYLLLASFAYLLYPIGGLLSGPICDRVGRRKAIMLACVPLVITWIMLGFAQSFPLICLGFTLLGLTFGLAESPSYTFAGEIR